MNILKHQRIASVTMAISFIVLLILGIIYGKGTIFIVGTAMMAGGNLIWFICECISRKKETSSLLKFARLTYAVLLIAGFILMLINLLV